MKSRLILGIFVVGLTIIYYAIIRNSYLFYNDTDFIIFATIGLLIIGVGSCLTIASVIYDTKPRVDSSVKYSITFAFVIVWGYFIIQLLGSAPSYTAQNLLFLITSFICGVCWVRFVDTSPLHDESNNCSKD
jgi:hypothetical protein